MHKGIIILVKADSKENALNKVHDDFMPQYQDQVWDWYAIGGRWSQTLAPKYVEFLKAIKQFDLQYTSGVEKHREELQKIWEDLGMKGLSPYADHYKLPDDGAYYDVIALESCIKRVQDWQQSPEDGFKELEEAKERWLEKPKEKGNEPDLNMYGYSLKNVAHLFQQDFSFETNVFNTESYNFSIPEDMEGWFAVMVDIHN